MTNMINGNSFALLQTKTGVVRNEIGEKIPQWNTLCSINGFLDLMSGEAKYATYDAKIQESTHIFICPFKPEYVAISAENSRMIISNRIYDITLIDNPMELSSHLEFYLKYTGGQ